MKQQTGTAVGWHAQEQSGRAWLRRDAGCAGPLRCGVKEDSWGGGHLRVFGNSHHAWSASGCAHPICTSSLNPERVKASTRERPVQKRKPQ